MWRACGERTARSCAALYSRRSNPHYLVVPRTTGGVRPGTSSVERAVAASVECYSCLLTGCAAVNRATALPVIENGATGRFGRLLHPNGGCYRCSQKTDSTQAIVTDLCLAVCERAASFLCPREGVSLFSSRGGNWPARSLGMVGKVRGTPERRSARRSCRPRIGRAGYAVNCHRVFSCFCSG